MEPNELYHYGVLGMKWGKRRARSTSSDYKKSSSLRSKKADELSDNQLKNVTKRLQLENNFNDAKNKQRSSGKKFVDNTSKQVLGMAVGALGSLAINAGIKYVKSRLS